MIVCAEKVYEKVSPIVSKRGKWFAIKKWRIKNFFAQRWREIPTEIVLKLVRGVSKTFLGQGVNLLQGRLYGKVWRKGPKCPDAFKFYKILPDAVCFVNATNGEMITFPIEECRIREYGDVWDYGCFGCHLIVTAGKNYVAGSFPNTNEPENIKFHGFGSGATAPAAGDTALQTEYTTEYAVNSTRPTGSQSTTTNVYTTVGTFSPDATVANTEWGLLTQAATGGGTLFDRQTYSAVNLTASVDSLQTTYALTVG